MSRSESNFNLEVRGMKAVCPLGEVVGGKMIAENKIPVISCEGGCFRGEIARMAAHLLGKRSHLCVDATERCLQRRHLLWQIGRERRIKLLL